VACGKYYRPIAQNKWSCGARSKAEYYRFGLECSWILELMMDLES
jgi:hypothetical protein